MTAEELINELESHFMGYTCVVETEKGFKEIESLVIKKETYTNLVKEVLTEKVIILNIKKTTT